LRSKGYGLVLLPTSQAIALKRTCFHARIDESQSPEAINDYRAI